VRCWVCDKTIGLYDEVCELPVAGALVHHSCFERETGSSPAPWVETLIHYLARNHPRAA
jgi:hypothetical protein